MPRLRVTDLATGATHQIEFPEPAYSAFARGNAEFDTPSSASATSRS